MSGAGTPYRPPGRQARSGPTDQELDALFDEIRRGLGVPFVNLIFHRLAVWPGYLAEVWQRSTPLLSTPDFTRAAEALRRLAAPPRVVPIDLPADVSAADVNRVRRLTDAYVYVQPKLLLLTAGWAAGLADEPLAARIERGQASEPIRVFDERADVPTIDLPPTDPTVANLFQRMVERRTHPGVASYYRSLATWPTLMSACWQALEPLTASSQYSARARELSRTATALATSLGLREAGAVETSSSAELRPLLEQWRDVQVPQLMFDTRHLQEALRSACPAGPGPR